MLFLNYNIHHLGKEKINSNLYFVQNNNVDYYKAVSVNFFCSFYYYFKYKNIYLSITFRNYYHDKHSRLYAMLFIIN